MNRLQSLNLSKTKTDWRRSYPYKVGDIVSLGKNIYECVADNVDDNPVSSLNWRPIL